jgi:anti-sigma regulatory factor (Ser/Thr protein kinase)
LDSFSTSPVLTIGNRLADLAVAGDWLSAQGASLGLDAKTLAAMRLCLEEALANVVTHAYADHDGHAITLILTAAAHEITLCIEDDGLPFDPTSAPEPANNDGIENATIGGRGLTLIRNYAHRLGYTRQDGANCFVMGFKRA